MENYYHEMKMRENKKKKRKNEKMGKRIRTPYKIIYEGSSIVDL